MDENGLAILQERYLQPGETVEQLLDRVSLGDKVIRGMMERQEFMPNSPTIFNLGVENGGTLSACFKFDVGDSLDSILDVYRKAALVLKAGGGVGYTVSDVRPEGALVNSTHGRALGPVNVLGMYQDMAHRLTQGGKREGAQMGIMDISHPDIRKFIHMKDEEPDKWETFNISVAITDEFMQKVIKQSEPKLRDKGDDPEYTLFMEICQSAWRTGDPGVYFIDQAEKFNPTPWLGKLTGTNPCGEVPLLDNEPCNLGSINLAKFVDLDKRTYCWDELGATVRAAVFYLDNVLDYNVFPDEAITKAAFTTRKLGLGVCGLADSLAMLGVHYDSQEGVDYSSRLSVLIKDYAWAASRALMVTKGAAPAWKDYNQPVSNYRHNATVTCIAPTGTIAQFMGASSGIEPHFALENTRKRKTADGWVSHIQSVDFGEFIPHTSMDIGYEWHIKHQAAWQGNVDLAVSKTINLPNDATVQDIFDSYVMMWELGCKGGTVYRDGSRVMQVLDTVKEVFDTIPIPVAVLAGQHGRVKLPKLRNAKTRKFEIDGVEGYITVGEYPNGQPGELFLNVSRQGSSLDGLFDGIAILTSLALQYGVPLTALVEKFTAVRFEPYGMTQDSDIPHATSILDYVFRRLGMDYLEVKPLIPELTKAVDTGMHCPNCGGGVRYEEACLYCASGCGWSRC